MSKTTEWAQQVKSFKGYLEGTKMASHTIKNYIYDLRSFENFMVSGLHQDSASLHKLTLKDLDAYHEYLKLKGLKTNSRRRKVLTLRRLLRFLTKRGKFGLDIDRRILAPEKIERIPFTVSSEELLKKIKSLPENTPLGLRNKCILLILAETGCQVSEVSLLQKDAFTKIPDALANEGVLAFLGKNERSVPISQVLLELLKKWAELGKIESSLFLGYNRFGPMALPMSSRGIEFLVKEMGPKMGFEKLVPRTFRHSIVLHWSRAGLDKVEIKSRLGLKTDYAFRMYNLLIKKSNPA